MLTRRKGIALAGLTAALAATKPLHAQVLTARPVRLVVPFEAGGTIDLVGRTVAAQITRQSGLNVIIDNRPGANGAIGAAEVARAAPDGYTVLNVSPSLVLNPLLQSKLAYTMNDFVPVTALGIGTGYLLVTRKDLPVRTVAELKALAGKSPKALSYGTPGIGNALHLATESLADRLGVELLHVPFKGSASALNAILAGQVDVMLLSPSTVIPVAKAGRLRVIAFTGEQRSPEFPAVPTMIESGFKDFVIKGTWAAWFAPAGTPAPVVARLQQEAARALQDPATVKALEEGGFEPDGRPPAAFARFVAAERERYAAIVRRTGIQVD